jgi:putative transposase
LNRAILDASPFELRRQLEYKALWRGGLLMAVPPRC